MIDDPIFCYRNAKGESLVLPLATVPGGPEVVVNRPLRLLPGTAAADLGSAIRTARQWCDHTLIDRNGPIPQLEATGEKSFSQFAKKWQLVRVVFDPILEVTPTTRGKKGGYWFQTEQAVCLPGDVSNEVLGSTVMEFFARSNADA